MNSKKYLEQIDSLAAYFKSGEASTFKLGLEIEHFILNEYNYRAVSYPGNNGIEGILKGLENKDWQGVYEDNKLLGLQGRNADVSLEPGGQFELSLHPLNSIQEVDRVYKDFLDEINPILKVNGKILLASGYQPVSSIDEIQLLPKKRYHFMYEYFKNRGKYAHNMMKGTASIQVNLDYYNEKDFRKKMRVAYFLSPLLYFFFDNSPFFEGKIAETNNVRESIWDNCDSARCGLIESVFNDDFGYLDYAEYILNMPAILTLKNNELSYTGDKLIKDIYQSESFNDKEIDHLLTMAFPDVRLKKYIEIRIGDSLPYPYSIAYALFWQGLLYNQTVLDILFERAKNYTFDDMINIKQDIKRKGLKSSAYGKFVYDFLIELFELASTGLKGEEIEYIKILKELFMTSDRPKNKTLNQYSKNGSKIGALQWCIVQGGVDNDRQDIRSI